MCNLVDVLSGFGEGILASFTGNTFRKFKMLGALGAWRAACDRGGRLALAAEPGMGRDSDQKRERLFTI